jgi:ubiquinone/menaquinone biosynthesis C-methylase UbiE
MNDENATVIAAWNTVLFDKFSRFKHLLTVGLGVHSAEFFRREPFRPGARVIDIGCGFGDTTVEVARAVGSTGAAAGCDCAANFIHAAEEDAKRENARNVSFFVADVQTEALGGPYDYAFSRFGTMFFNLPGAALRNIRRALVPGGEFSMIVWRRREDNPWTYDAERRVKEIVPVISHEDTDQVHCGPGPFSLSGADHTSSLLLSAGFQRIVLERHDADICIGRTLEEAVDFGMTLGPAGEIIRLAGEEGAKRRPQVVAALSEVFAPYVRPNGVWAPSSAWFVTAVNPAS